VILVLVDPRGEVTGYADVQRVVEVRKNVDPVFAHKEADPSSFLLRMTYKLLALRRLSPLKSPCHPELAKDPRLWVGDKKRILRRSSSG
jgi:hypothetical protein